MSRPPDLAWEALVAETQAMPEIERGALNVALKAIRAQCERDGLHPDSIPAEIRIRANIYKTVLFPGLTITPMALAKHFNRCIPRQAEKRETLPEMYARLKQEREAS